MMPRTHPFPPWPGRSRRGPTRRSPAGAPSEGPRRHERDAVRHPAAERADRPTTSARPGTVRRSWRDLAGRRRGERARTRGRAGPGAAVRTRRICRGSGHAWTRDAALIVPLAGAAPKAFLVVADPRLPGADAIERGARARDEFTLALELARLGHEAALHRRIQELLLGFSRGRFGDAERRRRARVARGRDQRALRRAADLGVAAPSPRQAAGARRLVGAGLCRGERARRDRARRRSRPAASAWSGRRLPPRDRSGC